MTKKTKILTTKKATTIDPMNGLRKKYYAQTLIVVVLIVVKKLGFLVITRDHGSFLGCHQVEILPTDLPELFKPATDLLEPRKLKIFGPKFSRKTQKV